MPFSLVHAALAALALTACTAQAPPPAVDLTAPASTAMPAPLPIAAARGTPSSTAAPMVPANATPPGEFTAVGGGLSVRLEVPPGPYAADATIEFGLEFRNDGKDELRIYLIDAPIFRALQSDLAIYGTDDNFLGSQPEPHPHGYIVSERDFPVIGPGATRRFGQPLRITPNLRDTGPLQVRWKYRNKIESWPGGVQTLDGATKPLFGGGRIPGIWLGEFTVAAPLPVAG
jgi:hypothetical protein